MSRSSFRGAVPLPSSQAREAGGTASGPVHLNSATIEQLDALPGVGPVTAQKIVDYRQQHGGFGSVDELDAVSGIGPARLADCAAWWRCERERSRTTSLRRRPLPWARGGQRRADRNDRHGPRHRSGGRRRAADLGARSRLLVLGLVLAGGGASLASTSSTAAHWRGTSARRVARAWS